MPADEIYPRQIKTAHLAVEKMRLDFYSQTLPEELLISAAPSLSCLHKYQSRRILAGQSLWNGLVGFPRS